MSLKSDLTIDASKFNRKNIDQETLDFNAKLIKIWADGPRWYEVILPIPSFSSPIPLPFPTPLAFHFPFPLPSPNLP
jgi:hypothetical protein